VEMLYIERITVRRIININLHVGSRVNCYLTALGRAFIAFLSHDKYGRLLAELLMDGEAVKHIGKRGEKLEAILEDVRRKGYAFNDDNWVPGLQAISAPVFNDQGEVDASLNICFISQMVRTDEVIEKFLPPLLNATRHISSMLGFDRAPRFRR